MPRMDLLTAMEKQVRRWRRHFWNGELRASRRRLMEYGETVFDWVDEVKLRLVDKDIYVSHVHARCQCRQFFGCSGVSASVHASAHLSVETQLA